MNEKHEKLIIAVLSGDDYPSVTRHLNENGFYVTLLNSSGSFLRQRNVTLMIGLEEARLDEALNILKTHAGGRIETTFHPGGVGMAAIPALMPKGGTVVFVIDVERFEKF